MDIRIKSIRMLVAVITISIMLMVTVISLYLSRNDAFNNTEHTVKLHIKDNLNIIQGVAEQFLELGSINRLNQVISSISSSPDIDFIIIFDKSGNVISSNHIADIGRSLSSFEKTLNTNSINLIRSQKITAIITDTKKSYTEGYISVCAKQKQLILRSTDCGFAVYRINLTYHYKLAEQLLFKEAIYFIAGIGLTVFAVLFLMKILIDRPAGHIISILNQFAGGNRTARIKVNGDNEITRICRSINTLLQEVVDDERALDNQKERLRAVIETTLDAIITINRHGIIESVNPAVEKHLGYTGNDLIGKNISCIMPAEYSVKHDQYMLEYLETGRKNIIGNQREVTAITSEGREVPVELSVNEMRIDEQVYFTGVLRDISERVKLRNAMKQISQELFSSNLALKNKNRKDPLTGVYNRGFFDETIDSEIRRSIRHKLPLTLMMIDVDHFKLYNDLYGHQQGDECLKSIASTIQGCLMRAGEIAARYGGEEFAAILPGVNTDGARAIAHQLNSAITELHLPHSASLTGDYVSISIGVATLQVSSNESCRIKDFIHAADQALYQAKASGRNRFVSTIFRH